MPRTSYSQNTYVGGAPAGTLFTGVASGTTTVTITGTTSAWNNLGATGGFNLALNYGQTTEEKIWCPAGSYNWTSGAVTISGISRGIDGTTAQLQLAGVSAVPILTALDLTEANLLVSQTLGNVTTTSGQAVLSTGTGLTFGSTTVASGTSISYPIITNGSIRGGTISGTLVTNSTLINPILQAGYEKINVVNAGVNGTTTISTSSGSVWYYSSAATGTFNLNITSSGNLGPTLTTGTAITTTILTKQGSPAYATTSGLLGSSPISIDNVVISSGQVYWQGGTAPGSGNANGIDIYSVTALYSPYGSSYETQVAALSPRAWYKLGEPVGSTTAADSSGNGYTGTVTGTVNFGQSGPFPYLTTVSGFSVNASSGYITSNTGVVATTNVSMGAWFNMPAATASGIILMLHNAATNTGYGFGIGSNSAPNADALGNTLQGLFENVRWIPTNVVVTPGWHFVVMTLDASGYPRFYLDGFQVFTDTGTVASAPTGILSIGSDAISPSYQRIFSGTISEVILFTSTLSAGQVLSLYQAGVPYTVLASKTTF